MQTISWGFDTLNKYSLVHACNDGIEKVFEQNKMDLFRVYNKMV
jgi:hypothetical protein